MKNLTAVAAALTIALPLLVSAQTTNTAQLTSQIQALLQQVSALQAQAGTSGSTGAAGGSACFSTTRTLKLGMSGTDVTALQQFLAADSSVYPNAQITGYFGALTQAAVQRWQAKHGVVSSGSPSSTGYGVVGPRTAAAMTSSCGGASGGASDAPVGGFIQVTPINGTSPLSVTVHATVNTTNSCTGAMYTLDWGDGTTPQQIVVPSGNCSQLVQSLTHVYTFGGTFRVTLAAGSHQTYATVSVLGAGPSAGSTNHSVSYGVPNETFNASPTSGTAPLTVTFSGTVNTNDAGFGMGDNTDALDFGDGTMSKVKLPASVGGWLNYSVSHTYNTAGGFVAVLYQGALNSGVRVGNVTIQVNQPTSGSGSNTFGIVSVTPSSSSLPVVVSMVTLLPSCASYQVNWGDGTAVTTATASCASGGSTVTLQHTFQSAGSYTIKLNDGSGATQASTSITIG
jgi:peptidoglycan hydrolase-like protein with peptidoglycan-binding domain